MKNFEITNRGNKLLDEAACWVANEGLDTADAITEMAGTYDDLGAIITALVAGGYIEEETIFEAAAKGLANMMDAGYDRW